MFAAIFYHYSILLSFPLLLLLLSESPNRVDCLSDDYYDDGQEYCHQNHGFRHQPNQLKDLSFSKWINSLNQTLPFADQFQNADNRSKKPSLTTTADRYFAIDYERNCFVKDGHPFRYVSGSMHYFRVPEAYWTDRLRKARLGGLNAIQSYIEWSSHEPQQNVYNFSGQLNFTKYFLAAQELGLSVIVRLGPFIASERDNMGLPYWLSSNYSDIVYRTSDQRYLNYVAQWYRKLLPQLVPLLYENGGPIIMGQVENEYGSYWACDAVYTTWLRDLIRHYLGPNFLLFTVDGPGTGYLKCGAIADVYSTVDFGTGTNVTDAFDSQRIFAPKGPLVNSEFYPGWFDVWGEPHSTVSVEHSVKTFDEMLSLNASVNIYMYHGGTSFGFMNGAISSSHSFRAMVTSYDYDAPITEDGKLTHKYFAFREVIRRYLPEIGSFQKQQEQLNKIDFKLFDNASYFPLLSSSSFSTSTTEVRIPLYASLLTDIFELMESMIPIESELPLTFEQVELLHGFLFYKTVINFVPSDPILLQIDQLHDRALIFVNGIYRTTLSRMDQIFATPLVNLHRDDVLGIFVENQGHTCCAKVAEQKGILGNVTLGTQNLTEWKMYKIFDDWTVALGPNLFERNFLKLSLPIAKLTVLTKSYTIDHNSFGKYLSKIRNHNHENLNFKLESLKLKQNEKCSCARSNQTPNLAFPINYVPSFYVSVFSLNSTDNDLYLDMSDCGRKGVAFINGYNLGRYWPLMGPQVTLYIPRTFLNLDNNTLILFELERNSQPCLQAILTNFHQLNGTTPDNYSD